MTEALQADSQGRVDAASAVVDVQANPRVDLAPEVEAELSDMYGRLVSERSGIRDPHPFSLLGGTGIADEARLRYDSQIQLMEKVLKMLGRQDLIDGVRNGDGQQVANDLDNSPTA